MLTACCSPKQAQAVSNTAWALATLAYLPEGDLLQELAERATTIIRTFRPQATSNTLCAPARSRPPVLLTVPRRKTTSETPMTTIPPCGIGQGVAAALHC